ncbi:MAG: hypothetical protein HKO59_12565, partial [Phycisphaerales bacterium]|nr:hypothetical protein [Phycisphaerales bacterium]
NATDWMMNYWLRSGHQSFMGVPIEVRAPFLDHRVVELAFTLPVEHLMRDGWMKWPLRVAMQPDLPAAVVWRRRKMGFPFPLDAWLAHNEPAFFAVAGDAKCPYLDVDALRHDYDRLRCTAPATLWRLMSLAMWWKRCVTGRRLEGEMAVERARNAA